MTHRKNTKTKSALQKQIVRAVASSSAIETCTPISEIELKLNTKQSKFSELHLA